MILRKFKKCGTCDNMGASRVDGGKGRVLHTMSGRGDHAHNKTYNKYNSCTWRYVSIPCLLYLNKNQKQTNKVIIIITFTYFLSVNDVYIISIYSTINIYTLQI